MIVSLAGQKGGVGKSTLAVCLAAEGVERGLSVLLVDADPQGTARTWGDVAAESSLPVPTIVAMGPTMHRPGQLDRLVSGRDLVVIDCPPRHGDVQRSALMVSDIALLPCGPTPADAWALASSIELVTEAQTVRPSLQAFVVITRKQARTAVGKSAREALESESGLPVLRSELGYRVAFQEALAAGRGVTTYAPHDPASAELRAVLDEVLSLSRGKRRHASEAKAKDHRSKAPVRKSRR